MSRSAEMGLEVGPVNAQPTARNAASNGMAPITVQTGFGCLVSISLRRHTQLPFAVTLVQRGRGVFIYEKIALKAIPKTVRRSVIGRFAAIVELHDEPALNWLNRPGVEREYLDE